MTATEIKLGNKYTVPVLFPDAQPQIVTVISREQINGQSWFRVQYSDGARLVVHPSNIWPL